jgi:hypothetical protein
MISHLRDAMDELLGLVEDDDAPEETSPGQKVPA